MNEYKAVNKNLVTFIMLTIFASALIGWIFWIGGKVNLLLVIIFLFDIAFFLGALYEYNKIKKQRISDLRNFAKVRNYKFYENPTNDQIAEFREFKAMSKILMPKSSHAFLNLFMPKEIETKQPWITTVSTTVSSGEYSSNYFTQVYKFNLNDEIPVFVLSGGYNFSFSNIFRAKNVYHGIQDLEEIDIEKFNFPKNKYKLYSSDENIKDFFTKEFIDLLNSGLQKKKATIYMESNGKNIVFFNRFKRHSLTGLSFYINLFSVLIESLKLSK